MTLIPFVIVLRRARLVGPAAVIVIASAATATAQSSDRVFRGLYVGAEVGPQHVIGGSLVDDVDMLQEDSRVVASFVGGARVQFSGFVLGGELGLGRTDGDLVLSDPARRLTVDYKNHSQWHWTLNGGHTIGARTLLFGYVSEVTREFDVTNVLAGSTIEQRDQQGLLRFGAGIEHRLTGPLHLRATVGTSRADFDHPTNIEVRKRLDAAVGIVLQF